MAAHHLPGRIMEPCFVPNLDHPAVMRDVLTRIIQTADVIGHEGPGRTVLAVTVPNWVIDELAAFGAGEEDLEPETAEGDDPT